MGALKEYAGVITAAVTVFAALGALGLWAINVQVTPELHRLDGRIEKLDGRIDRLDGKLDANLKVINDRFNLVDELVRSASMSRFNRLARTDGLNNERIDRARRAEIVPARRNDIETILLKVQRQVQLGGRQDLVDERFERRR